MKANKKIYLVNYYVGGTPLDSHTLGAYTDKKKAIEKFEESITEIGYTKEEVEITDKEYNTNSSYGNPTTIIKSWFIDDDSDDFWGGCEIQKIEIN